MGSAHSLARVFCIRKMLDRDRRHFNEAMGDPFARHRIRPPLWLVRIFIADGPYPIVDVFADTQVRRIPCEFACAVGSTVAVEREAHVRRWAEPNPAPPQV
ncbi:MAG: hypothetical protein WC565_05120 [Parcubacteria group bacterium]